MLVSIVIPCFNVEDYVQDCIKSAIGQSYEDIEVICIDNNSTDSTWDELTKLKKTFPSITIEKETKKGAPAARNRGLAISKGEWIQFLDADDLLLSDKILNQVNLLNPETSMVIGPCSFIKTNKEKIDRYPLRDLWKGLYVTQLGNTCSNLFRKSELLKIGGWDENFSSSQESKLMFDLLKLDIGVIYSKDIDTIIQERSSGQISGGNPEKRWEQYTDLRIGILEYLKKEKKEYFSENKEFYLSILFDCIRIYSGFNLNEAFTKYKANFDPDYLPSNLHFLTKLSYRIMGIKITNLVLNKIRKSNKY